MANRRERYRALRDAGIPAYVAERQRSWSDERVSKVISEYSFALEEFREWTGNRSFPDDIVEEIQQINIEYGFDPSDSFGYRFWYHRNVNGLDIEDDLIIDLIEDRDT